MKLSNLGLKTKKNIGNEDCYINELLEQSGQLKKFSVGCFGYGTMLLKIRRNIENFSKHQLENPNGISYVAENEGKIVGIMSGLYVSGIQHFKGQGFADLKALYIHPDFQHIGIGKALFDVFVNEIEKKGITKFVIGVLKDNRKARNAYEKWGGKLDEYTQPFVKLGVGYDEVFYTYDLTKENKLKGEKI